MKKFFALFALFLLFGYEANAATIVASNNNCGTNCSWSIDSDGVLYVHRTDSSIQTGSIRDFGWNGAPWYSNKNIITSVKIEGTAQLQQDGTYTNQTGITSIGNAAFQWLDKVESVEIPDSVSTIGKNAFYSNTSLQSLTIPNSVVSIDESSFHQIGATKIVISDSLTSIPKQAFMWNHDLEELIIGEKVESIGNLAFNQSTKLKNIVVPASLKELDSQAFYGIYNVEKIYCEEGNLEICQQIASKTGNKSTIEMYTKSSDGRYIFNGKQYASASDILSGKEWKAKTKRIYTVEEAEKVSKPTGNKIMLRYK